MVTTKEPVATVLSRTQLAAFEKVADIGCRLAETFGLGIDDPDAARQALRQLMADAKLTRAQTAAVVDIAAIGMRAVEALGLIQNTAAAETALRHLRATVARR